MLNIRGLTIFVIFSGFASILFVFLSEIFNLQRVCQRDVLITSEKKSVIFWKKMIVPIIYRTCATFVLLLILVNFMKQIWRKIKNEYLFALLLFVIFELAAYVPAKSLEYFYVEKSLNLTNLKISDFVISLAIGILIDAIEYAIIVIPSICKGISIQPPQTQRKGTTFVDNFEPDVDNNSGEAVKQDEPQEEHVLHDDNYDDLPDVDAEIGPDEVIDEDDAFKANNKLWIYVLAAVVIAYFFDIVANNVLRSLKAATLPPSAVKEHPILSGFAEGLTEKHQNNIVLYKDEQSLLYKFDVVGVFSPKKVISEKLVNESRREEMVAAGSYMNYVISSHFDILVYIIGLLKPLIFAIIFRIIDQAGLAVYHLKPAKPTICTLLIAFGFFNTLMVFGEPILKIADRTFQAKADCFVGKKNLPIDKFIINYARGNFETVTHHPIFALIFLKSNQPGIRQANIKACIKAGVPKL